jgi:hypothetical protein
MAAVCARTEDQEDEARATLRATALHFLLVLVRASSKE